MLKNPIRIPNLLIIITCILLALACNLSGSTTGGLHLDSRDGDGSVSGRYQYSEDMGSKSIIFSVSPDGKAVFEVDDERTELAVDFTTQNAPFISWQGYSIDGLGALSSEEDHALNSLLDSDLAYALAMIPLDLSCQGEENIDPKQLAALLYPLQMRFKYQITDRATAASILAELSECVFNMEQTDNEVVGNLTLLLMAPSNPVPVVMGYFPFDEIGAVEASSSTGNQAMLASLDLESELTKPHLSVSTSTHNDLGFDNGPIQNEWGPCKARCRGACGPDCTHNNCQFNIEERCEKNQEGQNDGFFSLVHVYDCGVHPACIKHDACYDDCNQRHGCGSWAAAVCMHAGVADPTVPWATIFGLNISCDRTTLNEEDFPNVKAWMRGYGPQPERQIFEYHDKAVAYEYDPVTCPLLTEQEEAPAPEAEIPTEGETTEEAAEPITSPIPSGVYLGQVNENTWEENVDNVNGKGSYQKNEVIITVSEDGSVSGSVNYTYVSVPLEDSAGCTNTLTYDGKGTFMGTLNGLQGEIDLDKTLYRTVTYSCDGRGDSDTVEMVYPLSIQITGNQMTGTGTLSFSDFPNKTWTLSFTAEKP